MTDMENDIGTALMRLRSAFAKHRIKCPDVFEYSNVSDAYEAKQRLWHGLSSVEWVMDDKARPYGEMCFAGFTIRFEARKIERPTLGAELDDGISGRVFLDDLPRGKP